MGIISIHIYAKYANSTDAGPLYERQQYKMKVVCISERCTCISYGTVACILFSSCLLALCLIDLTSLMGRRPKRFSCKSCMHSVLHLVIEFFSNCHFTAWNSIDTGVQKHRIQSNTCMPFFFFCVCKIKHSSPFTDAAGKSVSPLSQKTIWKPTSSLFIQEGILWCFESIMNFMDQGERKMLQAKTSIIQNGSFLNPNLLFASFCTVICFGFGLIIPLDNICFQMVMTDKRQLSRSYLRTSLNYYGL